MIFGRKSKNEKKNLIKNKGHQRTTSGKINLNRKERGGVLVVQWLKQWTAESG